MTILSKWSNFCFLLISEQTCSAKFTQEIKDCRILEGQKAKFEGVYTGNPPPEVTWEFNGVLIENDKDIQIKVKDHRTSLTILEGKTSHNGHYTCRVKNELGSDRTRALLTVKGKKMLWLFFEKIQIDNAKLRKFLVFWKNNSSNQFKYDILTLLCYFMKKMYKMFLSNM